MAWQDREYARPGSGGRSFWSGAGGNLLRGRSVVSTLIWVNVAAFAICALTEPATPPGLAGDQLAGGPVLQLLDLRPDRVLRGEVWRLVTSQYLHASFWHIFMNMLGLHLFGRSMEEEWGSRRFLVLYTCSGTLGMLAIVGLTFVGWLSTTSAVGASGCVLGLLGACAVRHPDMLLYIQFLFPLKIKTAAIIFCAAFLLNALRRGPNAGGDVGHLAGLLFGAWWAYRGAGWWDRMSWRRSQATGRPRRVHVQRFNADAAQSRSDEGTIDRILKKVHEGGLHSLSEAEKQALREATDRQRIRDARPSSTL